MVEKSTGCNQRQNKIYKKRKRKERGKHKDHMKNLDFFPLFFFPFPYFSFESLVNIYLTTMETNNMSHKLVRKFSCHLFSERIYKHLDEQNTRFETIKDYRNKSMDDIKIWRHGFKHFDVSFIFLFLLFFFSFLTFLIIIPKLIF